MRRGTWLGLAALVLALGALPALAEVMYARFSTPVRSARSLGAAALGTLEQGEAVQVVARDGRYYRLLYGGKTGWVYFNKLASDKPEDVASALGGGLATGGFELTELEAGGALRGLSPMAESYARTAEVPQWAVQAVEQMQQRGISPAELEDFQKEGRLGEYGEEVAE